LDAHDVLIVGLAVLGLAVGLPQRALIARFIAGPRSPRTPGTSGPQSAAASAFVDRLTSAFVVRPASALVVGGVTAVLLGVLAARVPAGYLLGAACWLAACAVPLAFIDVATRRLPDALTAAAYAGTVAALLAAAATGGHWGDLVRALLGGVALTGFYLLLALISPSGMGLGDVKLAASLGTLLAWVGWRPLILGGFAGFLLAAVYSVALLAAGRATRKQHIPLGPFMIAGALAVIMAFGR
jgi:leader peptidase (prepilin peptidase) / N-methyltransferase